MSDEPEKAADPSKPKKSGGMVGMLLPALLAGGAAFGAVKLTSAHEGAPHEAPAAEAQAPGPTLTLEPFLVTIPDQAKKPHAMKVTLAIEFGGKSKEEGIKSFTPRVRDATLTYLRSFTFEDATDTAHTDKLRTELLEKLRASGITPIDRVLITDFVVQ